MKKWMMLFVSLLMVVFVSCSNNDSETTAPAGQQADTPKQDLSAQAARYNDRLVVLQMRVSKKMRAFNISLSKRRAEPMNQSLAELQAEISAAADEMADIPGFEGDKSLRNAHLDLMEFMEEICNAEFVTMVDYLTNPEGETDDTEIDELEKRLKGEGQELENNLAKVQQDFAKKYNLKLTRSHTIF
jgi:hypothetical protein